ncbi:MAG: hypothetical protein AB7E76_02900 [Deferribacterales bacterium]|jgi:hypothetical protein
MSAKFDSLRNEINDCFYEIVGIINEIISHRTDSFTDMLKVSEEIQRGSESFVDETDKVITAISDDINDKIQNLNMNKMKQDIVDATSTFIAITDELELLSYNTICRTMALGDKGSTITHISKEIKKYSTTVKSLLDVISVNFNEMFNRFKSVSDHLMDNKLVPEDTSLNVESMDDFVMTSDASVLIENSQFHDIFMQELEIINDALSNTSYTSAYEAGIIFGIYEKAMAKLDFVKYGIQEKLENIRSVMGDFIYTFNTDLQNIIGKTNILRSELGRVSELSKDVCDNVNTLTDRVAGTKDILYKTKSSVDMLGKQSKTFRNLVVITAVEVARINDESLRSVVVSMNQTEAELQELITKLHDNIDIWSVLRTDFMATFDTAQKSMDHLCRDKSDNERNEVMQKTLHLDDELNNFRKIFTSERYVNFFESTTGKLVELFGEFNDSVSEEFMNFNNSLGDDILSDEEFTNGRNDAELKDILAEDDDQSSVEFF